MHHHSGLSDLQLVTKAALAWFDQHPTEMAWMLIGFAAFIVASLVLEQRQ